MRLASLRKSQYVHVNGYKGRYLKAGHGPALVIIASPLILATNYKPTIRCLAKTHTVYVVDLPGAGRSSRVKKPWSLDEYTQWLDGFFEQIGVTAAIVIGHSNSGAIAISFAISYPEHVAKLVITDSTGMKPRSGSFLKTIVARAYDTLLEPWFTFVGAPSVLYNLFWHTRSFLHQVWLAPVLDISSLLPRLKTPTLLAWGGRDHTVPRVYARQLHELIPQSEYVTFQKGSHDWIVEYPHEFARILNANEHLLKTAVGNPKQVAQKESDRELLHN